MKKSILKGVKCLTLIPIMLGVSSTATLANAVDYEDSENSYEYSFEAETKHEFNSFDNIEAGQENYKEFILEGSDYSEDDLQPSVITQYNEKIPVGNEPNSPYVTPNPITGQTPKSAFARMITNDVLNFGKVKIEDPTVKTDQSFSDLRWSLWADWINLTMKKGNGLQDGARLIIEPDTGTYLKINKISQKGLTYEADVTLHVNGNLAFWGEVDSGWNGYGIDTWTTDDSYVNFDVDFKFTYSPTYNSSSKQFSLNPNVEVSHKNFAWYIYVRTSVDYSDEIADEVYQKLLEKIRDNVVPGFVSQIRDKFQAKVQAGNQVFSLGGIEPQWESQIDKIVKNYNGAGKYVKAATDRINYLLWSNNALSGTGLLLEAVACDDLTSTNPSAYMNTTMTRDGIDFNNYESSTIADHCDMIIGQEGFNLGDATNLNGPTPWTEAWGTTLRNTLLSRDVDHNHLPLMSRDRYQYVYGINDWVRYFDKQGWEEVKNQYAIEKNQYDADMDLWVSRCAPSTASLSDATPAVIDCNNFPVAPIEPDIDDYRGKVKQPRGTGRCDLEMRTYTNNPDSIENTAPVMIIHGGSWKTRYGSFSAAESYVSHLTNRGYTVYMPFYRLTGKNADTTEACQGANWERINGSTSFTPVSGNERAMEYVQNRHPGQQIKLIGFSAGSNMALNIVQKNPDDISKAILFYPPTDLEEFYDGYYTGTDNPDYIGNYGSANRYSSTYDHMAGYLEDFLLIKDFNDINVTRDYFYENSLAKKISESPASYPPLYIMHSAKDNTVPWRQSMHLCNAYGGTLGDSSVENGSVTKLEWTGARRKFECNPESSHPTIFDYLKRGVATYGNSPIHAFDVDIPGFGLIVNDSDKKEFTHSIKSALYWLDTDNVVRFKSPSIDDIQVSVSGDSAILDVKVSHPSGSSKVQSVYAYAVPCVHVSGEDWECELTDLPQGIYSNQLYVWAEDVYGNRGVPELVPPFEITAVNYTVSANAGNGGHITPSVQTVEGGYSAAFTVTPSTGYRIASVTGCNGSLSGNTYTTGAITGDCTVQANFSKNSYIVTANAGSGGSISPSSRAVNHGSSTSFTVTPNSGYSIDVVSGCGGSLSGSTYTTGSITAGCTVTATFKENAASCIDYETDLEEHLANDRVWSEYTGTCWGTFCYGGQWNIYTKGSDILISHNGKEIHSLYEKSDKPGYWYPGECPVIIDPVPPVIDSVDTPVVTRVKEENGYVYFNVTVQGTASDANGDLKEVRIGYGMGSIPCSGSESFTCLVEINIAKTDLPTQASFFVAPVDEAGNWGDTVEAPSVTFEDVPSCVDFTETLNEHLADDRIWSEYTGTCWGTFCYGGVWNIYTKGSNILIGHDGYETHTLHELASEPGTWYPGACPAQ